MPEGAPPRMTRVTEVREENYRTTTLTLEARIRAAPGQFVMLWLPGLDEKPFSLMAADPIRVTVAAVGPFSRALHCLSPGERVWFRGPFGQGFAPRGDDHLLVGGGYGVAPLRFLAEGLEGRVRAVVGARTESEVLLTEDLRAAGAEVIVTTEDGSAGLKGRVTDAIVSNLQESAPTCAYACGPHGMLDAVALLGREHGLRHQLAWEAYMRCGIGICGSCEHGGALVCADGPVLRWEPGEDE